MITYFKTRDEARAAAKAGGKFTDFGKDSEKGKRWACVVESTENVESTPSLSDNDIDFINTQLHTPHGSIMGEQVLKSPNKKPVVVEWRRNLQAMRLRVHLNKTA